MFFVRRHIYAVLAQKFFQLLHQFVRGRSIQFAGGVNEDLLVARENQTQNKRGVPGMPLYGFQNFFQGGFVCMGGW